MTARCPALYSMSDRGPADDPEGALARIVIEGLLCLAGLAAAILGAAVALLVVWSSM